jgi:hypothetical protein
MSKSASELVLEPSSTMSAEDKKEHQNLAEILEDSLSTVRSELEEPENLSQEEAKELANELLKFEKVLHEAKVVMTPEARHDFEQSVLLLQAHVKTDPKDHAKGAEAPKNPDKTEEQKSLAETLKKKLTKAHAQLKNPQKLSRENAESLAIELLNLEKALNAAGVVCTPAVQQDLEQCFEHLQDHAMREHCKESAAKLSAAWPKGVEEEPKAFTKLARELDDEKIAMFVAANSSQKHVETRWKTALDCANILHGKPGHNDNVVQACTAFLGNPATVASAFGLNGPDAEPSQMLFAAKWHGLADAKVPVSVLAGKNKISTENQKKYIETRSPNSAAAFHAMHSNHPHFFAADETAKQQASEEQSSPQDDMTQSQLAVYRLIARTKPTADKADTYRNQATQFLDLMDRVVAMAAKPYFQIMVPQLAISLLLQEINSAFDDDTADTDALMERVQTMTTEEGLQTSGSGHPKADTDKIFTAIAASLAREKLHIAPNLMESVRAFVERGDLDKALTARRPEDLYVRT